MKIKKHLINLAQIVGVLACIGASAVGLYYGGRTVYCGYKGEISEHQYSEIKHLYTEKTQKKMYGYTKIVTPDEVKTMIKEAFEDDTISQCEHSAIKDKLEELKNLEKEKKEAEELNKEKTGLKNVLEQ